MRFAIELDLSAYPINVDYNEPIKMAQAHGIDAYLSANLTSRSNAANKESFFRMALGP